MIRQPFKRRCAVCNRMNFLCGTEDPVVVLLLARLALRPRWNALVEPLVFLFCQFLKSTANTGFLVAARLVEVGLVG